MNTEKIDISHFRIESAIGKGGFGKVNCVTHLRTKKLFAMKTLNKYTCLQSKSGVKQVFCELELLKELRHPFLCNAHYGFQDADNLYLVSDLALGGDLKYQLDAHTRFTEEYSKFLCASIILAVKYLHELEIVHRDIKPANILMKEDGYIFITDLGISSKVANLNPEEVSGTDGYISPESYHRKKEKDTWTPYVNDWFAVGCCLYQFVIGVKPFETAKMLNKDSDAWKSAMAKLRDPRLTVEEDKKSKKKKSPRKKERAVSLSQATDFNPPSPQCQDFVEKLLDPSPYTRLGVNGAAEVQNHPFFDGFDWKSLEERTMPTLFKPDISKKNVDARMAIVDLEEQLVGFNAYAPALPRDQQHHFKNYGMNQELTPEDLEFAIKYNQCCCVIL
eukprot:c15390_g1_i1.p1 GENE.c15390_g1_i1~~c15390_g1_i1.p1  ORF type:complete len:390 (+),score=120.24 c15390_g1_i1:54-1223(+)